MFSIFQLQKGVYSLKNKSAFKNKSKNNYICAKKTYEIWRKKNRYDNIGKTPSIKPSIFLTNSDKLIRVSF